MQTILAILVVIALLGGGYYWYTNMSTPTPQETADPFGAANVNTNTNANGAMPPGATMEDGTIPESDSTSTAGAVKEFTVTNSGFNFSPKTITVKRGDRVRITYTNGGGTHDFRIEGYDVGTKVLSANASETFEFVADEVGTFESYCSVGNHRAMGMVGTFTVTQ